MLTPQKNNKCLELYELSKHKKSPSNNKSPEIKKEDIPNNDNEAKKIVESPAKEAQIKKKPKINSKAIQETIDRLANARKV